MNEKAMASLLPIHHRWCIADKLLGSNKLLLRGWPPSWKRKLPHGHPSIHSLLFSIQQSELVSVQGNSYQHYYLVHWQKRTNIQFVSRHGMESIDLTWKPEKGHPPHASGLTNFLWLVCSTHMFVNIIQSDIVFTITAWETNHYYYYAMCWEM